MPTAPDVLIIGSGQAGNPLAAALAKAGRRVVLVEHGQLGGSCINYGCSPAKTLLASAERAHLVRTAARLGVLTETAEPKVDLAAVMARKEAVVGDLREGVRDNLAHEHRNLTVLHGHARFTGPHTVQVMQPGGKAQELSTSLIFINTGTRPAIPELPGLAESGYLTTTELLDLRELPEHLLILGGGYIGLEFGQLFRRFGSRVTIIETGAQALEREDDDVCAELQQHLTEEGVEFVFSAHARRVSRGAGGAFTLTADTPTGERRLSGSHLLVATGRQPNSDQLSLEKAGIKTDADGYIKVNTGLETNVRGVYALGDVHGGPQFTHLSYDDFRLVRDALLHGRRRSARQRPLPYCVFTDPPLGRIGLSEAQAQEKKLPYRVAKMPVSVIGRAQQTGEAAGFWKVLVGPDDRLLGAAIVGAAAGEIMSVLQVAMAGRLKYQQLQEMIFAHPVWAEGLNNVFRDLRPGGRASKRA